jgi:alpha-L-fucosidase
MLQDWFVDAKFGVFLHWGIYSAGKTSESWAFFSGEIGYEDYMAQAKTSLPKNYDPVAWARVVCRSRREIRCSHRQAP